MPALETYRLNAPLVIEDVIDGEAIIANLSIGLYYSLDPLGSRVWQALMGGASTSAIVVALSEAYEDSGTGSDQVLVARGVAELLSRLLAEDLLVAEADARPTVPNAEVRALLGELPQGAFVAPVLDKYTDMEMLLQLDPIHEVDDTGWPRSAGAAEEPSPGIAAAGNLKPGP